MSGEGRSITLVDSHAHLDFSDFDTDRETVLQRAEDTGIKLIVNIGFDLDSSQKSIELAGKYPFVYAAIGIHPHDAGKAPAGYIEKLEQMAASPKVVAIGEMGLDFFRDRSPRPIQREVFRQQLRLARKVNLPIVIHDRDAHEEVMQILEEEDLPEAGGVMHCFSGDTGLAKRVLAMGLYISIAGPVTYPKNNLLREVAAMTPPGRLLIETDAPFLPPNPFRGKRNEPAYVRYTAEKVAALRGKTTDYIGRLCQENLRELIGVRNPI